MFVRSVKIVCILIGIAGLSGCVTTAVTSKNSSEVDTGEKSIIMLDVYEYVNPVIGSPYKRSLQVKMKAKDGIDSYSYSSVSTEKNIPTLVVPGEYGVFNIGKIYRKKRYKDLPIALITVKPGEVLYLGTYQLLSSQKSIYDTKVKVTFPDHSDVSVAKKELEKVAPKLVDRLTVRKLDFSPLSSK